MDVSCLERKYKRKKKARVRFLQTQNYMLCVCSCGGAKWSQWWWWWWREVGERVRRRKGAEQTTVTADGALRDKQRRWPGRIKEQIQMVGAACRSALDCSFNGTGGGGGGNEYHVFHQRPMHTFCTHTHKNMYKHSAKIKGALGSRRWGRDRASAALTWKYSFTFPLRFQQQTWGHTRSYKKMSRQLTNMLHDQSKKSCAALPLGVFGI